MIYYWTGLNFQAQSVLMFGSAHCHLLEWRWRPGPLEVRPVHSSNLHEAVLQQPPDLNFIRSGTTDMSCRILSTQQEHLTFLFNITFNENL